MGGDRCLVLLSRQHQQIHVPQFGPAIYTFLSSLFEKRVPDLRSEEISGLTDFGAHILRFKMKVSLHVYLSAQII
jgi:hypothetical protein